MTRIGYRRHAGNHLPTGSDPIPAFRADTVRVFNAITTNTLVANTLTSIDYSGAEFKANDDAVGGHFKARSYGYTGRYYQVNDFSSIAGVTAWLQVNGPGLFTMRTVYAFNNMVNNPITGSWQPSNAFQVYLEGPVTNQNFSGSYVDTPTDTAPVPLAQDRHLFVGGGDPADLFESATREIKTFSPITLGAGYPNDFIYWVRVEETFGLRNKDSFAWAHVRLMHNLKNNAGTLINMPGETYISISCVRHGEFDTPITEVT